jgi:hypothetical protein
MKRALTLLCLAALLVLAGCQMMYSIFPGMDPIVGTWKMTRICLPSGPMGGDGTWHSPADYTMSGSATYSADNTFTGSYTTSTTTTTSSGTWTGDYGVYTMNITSSVNQGVVIITLSSDNKTAYVAANGVSEQMTKQ